MEKYKIGDTIRFLRKKIGLTQEQLAEDICSPVTISRIESGVQFPSENILKLILDKLGQDINNINITNFTKDDNFENLFNVGKNYLLKNNFEKTKEIIEELHKKQNLDLLDTQKLNILEIGLDMGLEIYEKNTTSSEFIKRIYKALSITKKNIDLLNIDKIPLSLQEINLLSFLAIAFSNNNMLDEAIEIDKKLIKCFDFYKIKTLEQNTTNILILMNLAQFYEIKRMYFEAINTLDEALDISKNSVYSPFLCEICFLKGRMLCKQGKITEGKEILEDIYPYFKIAENKDIAFYIEKIIKI